MKNWMKLLVILFMVCCSAVASGCAGGGAEVRQQTTTLGQELQDLDEAYKKGIISEKEYKDLKEEAIDKYDD